MLDRPTPPGPRSKYPGQLVLQLRGDTLNFLTRTVRTYGDVTRFRVGFPRGRRDLWVFNDPNLIRDVLVTQTDKFTKGPALQRAKPTLGEGLLTSEGEFHRRQRRLSQPAFHPQRVAGYAEVFSSYARRVADRWADGQTLDVHEEMMGYTLRVVAKTLFDAELEEQIRAIGHAMDVSVKMFTRAMTPWGPLLDHLPLPSNFRYRRAYGRLTDTIKSFIRQRRESGADRGDLLSTLLRARDTEGEGGTGGDNTGMSDKQLLDECYTLFTAGHETTANALTFTWYLVATHPEVERRLHEEVNSVLGDRLPTADDMDRLPYTRAVVAESMRLYPPAWGVGRAAREPVRVGPWHLGEGDVVLVSQWVTHRDARWWPDPERFDPGRWLDERAKDARPRYAYFPFGGGPRQCIGEAFAWMEATLALATVARQWRMEYAGTEPLGLQATITLRPRHGMPMVVRRR